MKRLALVAGALLALVFVPGCHHDDRALDAAVEITPGMWKVTATEGIKGVPSSTQQHSGSHCVTAKDLAKGYRQWIPELGGCTSKNFVAGANKINWDLACTGNYKGTGSGDVVFSGDSYEGEVTIHVVYFPHPVFHLKLTGTRTGDCP